LLLFALLPLALGGCFISSEPLITPASADHPWADSRAQEFHFDDGKWKSKGYVTLRRSGPYYVLRDEESRDVTRFLVHQIGDDRYVAQSQDASGVGNASYSYSLLIVDGQKITTYSFDQASKRCRVPGVDVAALKLRPHEDDCGVDSIAALIQVFQALERSQPKPETLYVIQP